MFESELNNFFEKKHVDTFVWFRLKLWLNSQKKNYFSEIPKQKIFREVETSNIHDNLLTLW